MDNTHILLLRSLSWFSRWLYLALIHGSSRLNGYFFPPTINRPSFLENFQVHSKTMQKVQRVSIYPTYPYVSSLPCCQHPVPQWYIVTFTLSHPCPPKSIIYIRAQSWCCTSSAHMWYHIKEFHCLKSRLGCAYSSLLLPQPLIPNLKSFTFSRMWKSCNHTVGIFLDV